MEAMHPDRTPTTAEVPPLEPALRLAVILGSTREGRFGPVVAEWFTEQVAPREDFEVDLLDLAAVDLPTRVGAEGGPGFADYHHRLERADAFVVITPEYNHGYPAALKQGIDVVHGAWRAKPVGFVSYGGRSGGLRAVEQLRPVFAELHATTVRDCVSLHEPWSSAGHGLAGAEEAAERMVDQLAWWAFALRRARRAWPYAA